MLTLLLQYHEHVMLCWEMGEVPQYTKGKQLTFSDRLDPKCSPMFNDMSAKFPKTKQINNNYLEGDGL